MEPTPAVIDEPLPPPTGPKLMAMFLEQPVSQTAATGAEEEPVPPPPADAPRSAAAATNTTTTTTMTRTQVEPDSAVQPQVDQAVTSTEPAAASEQTQTQQQQQQQQQHAGMTRVEYEACIAMHGILSKYKEADPFRQPVDVDALGIPDYYDVIKKPMDLKTVREKLRSGHYKNMQEWRADVQLIWDNARKYNGENHPVTNQALKLQTAMERRLEDALQQAKAGLQADARGEPQPRKPFKPRSNTEQNALASSMPASSESDSMMDDAPMTGGGRAQGPRLTNAGSSGLTQRSPEPAKPAIKRERDAATDTSGRAAKRRPPAAAASLGNMHGLDLDSLTALLNTPFARQLGAEEPDDLAFIALWKRLMTRKQQLMATSTDADGLRASNQQLRSTINGLHEQLNEERRACQAAVAAKVGVEDRLEEVTKQLKQLQADHEHQKGLLEQQRGLLEQQQELLRKFARQKQAQAAAEQQQQQQPPPQPRPAA